MSLPKAATAGSTRMGGADATTLDANAALRSIGRRVSGESYEEFLVALAQGSCIETPTREDLAKIDRNRPGKGSNKDGSQPQDPHLRSHLNLHKRQLIHLAGFNLRLVLRQLLGAGTPRAFQGRRRALAAIVLVFLRFPRPLPGLLGASRRWKSFLSRSCWPSSATVEAT